MTEAMRRRFVYSEVIPQDEGPVFGAIGANPRIPPQISPRFAEVKESWLLKYLELPNGLPSDDTFRRVIARLKPSPFDFDTST